MSQGLEIAALIQVCPQAHNIAQFTGYLQVGIAEFDQLPVRCQQMHHDDIHFLQDFLIFTGGDAELVEQRHQLIYIAHHHQMIVRAAFKLHAIRVYILPDIPRHFTHAVLQPFCGILQLRQEQCRLD
ncbi:hypothetical protein D3C73_1130450 [compost metagenome]